MEKLILKLISASIKVGVEARAELGNRKTKVDDGQGPSCAKLI